MRDDDLRFYDRDGKRRPLAKGGLIAPNSSVLVHIEGCVWPATFRPPALRTALQDDPDLLEGP